MANNQNTENNNLMVPFVAYESALNRSDKHNRWLIITIIVLIILLALTNMVWVYEWNQYDYVDDYMEIDVGADGDGTANYIGDDGDITYGGTREDYEANEGTHEA
jgi:hypothetical protein